MELKSILYTYYNGLYFKIFLTGKSISRHSPGDYGYTGAFDLLKASGTIGANAGRELAGTEIAHGKCVTLIIIKINN